MMFPLFSGSGYKFLVVIFNGCVLAEDIPRTQALWAHILQFAALYVFGASYEFDRDENTYPANIRNFWKLLYVWFWKIRPKFEVKGKPPKMHQVPKGVKGQIISECPYDIIVTPKIPTNKFPRFLPQPLRRGQIKNFIKAITIPAPS